VDTWPEPGPARHADPEGAPVLFSTSHPPAVAAACIAAIHVLQEEPELINRLWVNTIYFKAS